MRSIASFAKGFRNVPVNCFGYSNSALLNTSEILTELGLGFTVGGLLLCLTGYYLNIKSTRWIDIVYEDEFQAIANLYAKVKGRSNLN